MSTPADLYEPFRPRAARGVGVVLMVLTLAATVAMLVLLRRHNLGMPVLDTAGTLLVASLIAWFCYRQATVAAVPDSRGLTVRNLLVVRHLAWQEIVSVRYGDGRPWAQLDLADGDTLAVMAVQRADGERSAQEARRMATLVAIHEPRHDS